MSKYICKECGNTFNRKTPFNKNEEILCRKCKLRNFYKEHPEKMEEKIKKGSQTYFKKTGYKNPNVRKKISKALKDLNEDPLMKEEILSKRKESNLERFGVEFPALRSDILNKGLETQRKNNNGLIGWEDKEKQIKSEKRAHSKSAENKRRATIKERFGVEYASQNELIKQKVKETYMERTGYDHPMHNPEIIHSNKGYLFEDTHFDSSWELAYYIWLKDNKKEFIYHPNLYMDYIDEDGVSRIYQPDFLVEGTFYEIKGDQFFNEKGEPYNKYTKKFWWNKYNALKENKVKIIYLDDIKFYLRYIKDNYGKNYLKQFRTSKLK